MHIAGGSLKGRSINAPKGSHTRPTSARLRETLFNICQGYIEGASFLDLFAGSGAIGLEALSRGASSCTFVDNDRNSIRAIQSNLKAMDVEDKGKVLSGNVFSWVERLAREMKNYTVIYADPPYEACLKEKEESVSYSQHLLLLIDKLPLLAPGGELFIEDAAGFVPDVRLLTTLKQTSARQAGRSTLLQFRRLTI